MSRAEPNHEGQYEHPEELLNEDLPSYLTRLDAAGAEGPGPNSRTSRLPSFLEIFWSDSLKEQRGGGILSYTPLKRNLLI